MSASEKLGELAQHKPGNHWDAEVNAALRSALPQIIAVVEAAERREDFAAPGVARLVADLDEVLTVGGKTPDAKPGNDELRDEGIHDAFDANQWD